MSSILLACWLIVFSTANIFCSISYISIRQSLQKMIIVTINRRNDYYLE
jgi:hypothetical protein